VAGPSTDIRDPNVWQPRSAPQERFLRCAAHDVLYGGAAGGGKTDALLVSPLRWVGNPNFRGVFFRRNEKDLWGQFWTRAREIYHRLGARWRAREQAWEFPGGAMLEMHGLQHKNTVHKFQGRRWAFVGFEELTHFELVQFEYMLSRNGSTDPSLPLRMRATTNPGGVGHEWVLKRWAPWLYPRPGHPRYDPTVYDGPFARPGEVLWFRRNPETEEDDIVPPGAPGALSRTFFPAKVQDNPFYAGTEYEVRLRQLSLVDRMQLLEGDWLARAAPGLMFKRAWFADKFLDAVPALVVARVRYWDLAATPASRAKNETAWTAGVRLAKLHDGRYLVEDIVRGRWSPGDVEKTIKATGAADPKGTRLVIERDPGQAGNFQGFHYVRELDGHDVHAVAPIMDKVGRAKPISAQAEGENVWLCRGKWNEAFLREAESFPEGVKDQIDSLSGGYHQIYRFGSVGSVSKGSREMQTSKMGGL
jgi:predicted phage terminase large subunit-like protein